MSIEYANICSSAQDHRQKFSVFKCIGSEEQVKEIKRKLLCCKEAFWRKDVLKTRGSEADVIRSTLIRTCTSEAEVIRGSEGSEAEDWKLQSLLNVIIITPIITEE